MNPKIAELNRKMATMPNEEHAHAIAAAVSDYIGAQNVRSPDRARACEAAYKAMVERITAALDHAQRQATDDARKSVQLLTG